VFSVAYQVSGSALAAFVDHVTPLRPHSVFLLDGQDHILAASPHTRAATLSEADPNLAHALLSGGNGTVQARGGASTFTSVGVPGTSWRIVLAVRNERLFASIEGWTKVVPWLIFALVAALAVLLVGLFARSLNDRARLAALSLELESAARLDPLTGLFNRRVLDEHLGLATARARRRGEPVSVLMIDLDRFKQINDRYGHAVGDTVLRAVADCMREILRADAIYGRLGGDEFLVVMPASDESDARTVARRLRSSAKAIDLRESGLPDGVDLSIGAATSVQTTAEALVAAADRDLYRVKAGRARGVEPVASR
jgi:diguanylate cyclase (GGDEF)-like protein